MYSHTKDDLLYTFTPSPNVATLGAALKPHFDNFNSQLKPIFEQLDAQMKPLKEYVIKQANLIKTKLNAIAKHYVKFLQLARHKVRQGFSALLPKPLLIARRYKSPPRIYTNKHFRVLVSQLIVLSSVITPNAPN
jgi:thiaminase